MNADWAGWTRMNRWNRIWNSLINFLRNGYVDDPSTQLTREEFDSLKSCFVDAGCQVSDLDETSFEITQSDYPVATRIYVTPFYLEWTTVIEVVAEVGSDRGGAELLELVNGLNNASSLAKFVADTEDQGSQADRFLLIVTAKLINGEETRQFRAESLSNFHTLWQQDIANAMLFDTPLELQAMLRV
jgi:hypothetical protein